ncbi:ufm1-specific protease 2-like isoform X2 [Oscarella lobularis]|uniref:ufm1-specific protease 2-like isoform X2 n=1 Tax=Oscarella lobularis TaxID=121494 RepID=UPI00331378AA
MTILHCQSIREFTDNLGNLFSHFESICSPAMIGGNIDAASKTLLGVAWNKSNPSDSHLLILDPHYSGKDDMKIIEEEGWVAWKPMNSLTPSSFYNICLPQFSAR